MRILIIEDDERILGFLKRGLEGEGHTVQIALSGEAGLGFVRMYAYDVILLDLYLPEMNGMEVCRDLRGLGLMTPVLMMTAKDSPEVQQEAIRVGVNDYLPKPFSFELLLAKIDALGLCTDPA
ncbi:MAG: response regulator transcription factor [Candidatus Manganitrophus sp.]|nr:response regulator transcription factor [Candidatus Manganitrophus sp.]